MLDFKNDIKTAVVFDYPKSIKSSQLSSYLFNKRVE